MNVELCPSLNYIVKKKHLEEAIKAIKKCIDMRTVNNHLKILEADGQMKYMGRNMYQLMMEEEELIKKREE